jgi:hypothetical protein
VTITRKTNGCAFPLQPAEVADRADANAARVPTLRDLSVSALQTVYFGVACYVGLSDCADRLEAIARKDR